mmetsp:Transcript_92903/g.170343  ORF Transcript_92903/g.170343 Transcript_92903/m.170343 type:complete len:336 (-) Transcript_92903:227-1234(-)
MLAEEVLPSSTPDDECSTCLDAAHSADSAWRVPECSICLETTTPSVKLMLSCGHVYCHSCISKYIVKKSEENQLTCCPQCKRELLKHELMMCLSEEKINDLALAAATAVPNSDCQQSTNNTLALTQGFDLNASAIADPHMKHCPSCNALIEKNGGCDHMRCRCGHSFLWSQVTNVAPCDCVNQHPKYGVWGSNCPNCTWKAVAKLAARRVGIVAVGVVAVPVVLVGGVIVLAATGAMAVTDKARTAARSRLPTSKNQQIERARSQVNEAKALVNAASEDLEREKKKWFNHAAIDAANTSLARKKALLRDASDALQELSGPELEETVAIQMCGKCW